MKRCAAVVLCCALLCLGADEPMFPTLPDSPLQLIEQLKAAGERYTITGVQIDYVDEADLPALVALLDSTEPCAFLDQAISSIYYPGRSTVGHEAAYLIEGFWKRYYPTELTSQRFEPNMGEMKHWYARWSHLKKLAEAGNSVAQPLPSSPADPQVASPHPVAVFTGDNSQVKRASFARVSAAKAWNDIWQRHGGDVDLNLGPDSTVNFEQCEVVVIFGGETWNSRGFRVESITSQKDEIVVRFDAITYQSAGGEGDRVCPFAFVVLPKTDKTIALEDNAQQYIGQPADWKEVACFVPSHAE